MTAGTLLLRQIHPNFVQQGRVTSQAFRPTKKDEGKLSVDNGDRIKPMAAWERFTNDTENASAGVMAVTHDECSLHELPLLEDGIPYAEHCHIDFSSFEKTEIERKAKRLSKLAQARGWIFEARRDN